MQSRENINIVGAGLMGLLTAYRLIKQSENPEKMSIHVYDRYSLAKNNASTVSLAWLNSAWPCSKKEEQATYDAYRLISMLEWEKLVEELAADGIKNVMASRETPIQINNKPVNSVYVLFGEKEKKTFLSMVKRLQPIYAPYRPSPLKPTQLSSHFPFLKNLPENTFLYHISEERLINPRLLCEGLVQFLKNKGVFFHWFTLVTPAMIKSQPQSQWILTAGNGCKALLKDTALEYVDFIKDSTAEVIHCVLPEPLDLKGKVFHFEPSATTPGFHLRNDENEKQLKIIVDYDSTTQATLPDKADAILALLNIEALSVKCDDQLKRPLTPDGRPLVELGLGKSENIHCIYGHNLYTNAAQLVLDFTTSFTAHQQHVIHQEKDYLAPFHLHQRFSLNFTKNETSSSFPASHFTLWKRFVVGEMQSSDCTPSTTMKHF